MQLCSFNVNECKYINRLSLVLLMSEPQNVLGEECLDGNTSLRSTNKLSEISARLASFFLSSNFFLTAMKYRSPNLHGKKVFHKAEIL